jgi:hypothetical protein
MLVRALIVLFSVLNLGAAVWWIAHDPKPPLAPVQLPAGVASLQLVDEARVPAPGPAATAVAAADATTAPPPAADGITAAPAPQCFSFGPFASNDAGSVAAAKLKPLVRTLATRGQAATSPRGWRVYLPPQASREQAEAVAQRIGAAGFSDFLIVREGVEANSIALGRYRGEDAANKRAQALNAAGFPARAEALGGPEAAPVWLDVVAGNAFDPRRAQVAIGAEQFRKLDCAVAQR